MYSRLPMRQKRNSSRSRFTALKPTPSKAHERPRLRRQSTTINSAAWFTHPITSARIFWKAPRRSPTNWRQVRPAFPIT